MPKNINKLKICPVLIFILVLSLNVISSQEVNINIKNSFSLGDQMYFDYSIISDTNQQIIFIPHIICPRAPIALLQQKIINLQTNVPYNDVYRDMEVNNQFESQTCTAYIQILSPIKEKFERNFSIIANPSFNFNIKLDKKVYSSGEKININYENDVQNPVIDATLTYPDETTQKITLPTTIKASQIGTYELDITISKQGYKDLTVKEQFGVIDKPAEIKTISSESLDKYKLSPPNLSNEKPKFNFWNVVFYIVVATIILLIIIVAYFLLGKR